METLNLLIIEDEETQLKVYGDAIDSFCKKKTISIHKTICKSFGDGEKALLQPFYDAAIIDLKLSSSHELEGKLLLEKVYQKIRIPIFVVSGSISQIDDIPETSLFKKRLRTELISNILQEIFDIYTTGITSFLRPDGLIDKKLSEIFWKNLSADLQVWIDHNNPKSLLRYILAHFQEHLDINPEGDFEEYSPSEVYIKPPIKKNIHTGDILKIDSCYYLVLNPACDIIIQRYEDQADGTKRPIRKAEKIVNVKAFEFDAAKFCLNKNKKIEKGKIKEYVTNNNFRYHYLPPFEKNKGFLLDFQSVSSFDFPEEVERIASISSPFIKDIIARFSNYYSRQGQPTYNQNSIVDLIFHDATNNQDEVA